MAAGKRGIQRSGIASSRTTRAPGVDDLDPHEAVEILRRLAKKRGAVGEAVREAIGAVVVKFDPATVAASVHSKLEALAVEDLWDRSGPSRDGYVDPAEESWVMVEEILQPHVERIQQYQRWRMAKRARQYCLAVLDGIDSYDRESSSEFKGHAEDDAAEAFDWVLYEWKRGESEYSGVDDIDKIIARRFPARVRRKR